MVLLWVAVGSFVVAALFGLTMLVRKLNGQEPTGTLATVHGIFAASALVLMLMGAFQAGFSGLLAVAAILFILTALGGFFLLSYHLRGVEIPTFLIFGHAGAAVVSLILLIISLL